MKVKIGISNRHIHLTKEDYKYLFGNDELTIRNNLSIENMFAANETVTIKSDKSAIENVRIIGPFRNYTQVEISKTDSYKLGVNPPVKESGDLIGVEKITIIGPKNELTKHCCIIATRHIHITKEDFDNLKIDDNKTIIKVDNEKKTVFQDVYFKITENCQPELHLDTDDANASLLTIDDEIEL